MRFITDCNPGKRGCEFCADKQKTIIKVNGEILNRNVCPYDECPYHELDDVESYFQYEKRIKKQQKAWLKKVLKVSEKYVDCPKST